MLQRRYLDNVPSIVPLLEREYRHAAARLEGTRSELAGLQHDKLKVRVEVQARRRAALRRCPDSCGACMRRRQRMDSRLCRAAL